MEVRTIKQIKIHSLFIEDELKAWSLEKDILVKYYQFNFIGYTPRYESEWIELKNINTYHIGLRVERL